MFVITTHTVYSIIVCSLSLFVLCDRIGADSLNLAFSQTSPRCLCLYLCFAVAESDLVLYTTVPQPALYKDKTTGLGWGELCCTKALQSFHSCVSTVPQAKPHSRGPVREPFLRLLCVHGFVVSFSCDYFSWQTCPVAELLTDCCFSLSVGLLWPKPCIFKWCDHLFDSQHGTNHLDFSRVDQIWSIALFQAAHRSCVCISSFGNVCFGHGSPSPIIIITNVTVCATSWLVTSNHIHEDVQCDSFNLIGLLHPSLFLIC